MYSVFAAELIIWSMPCMAKLNVMNSHTGLRPAKAEPTAIPQKPASVMGVSFTRSAPYFCSNPLVIWKIKQSCYLPVVQKVMNSWLMTT